MSTFQSPHASRHRRAKQAPLIDDATTSDDDEVHYHFPTLPPEEAGHVLGCSETGEAKFATGVLPFAPSPAAASPCAKTSRDSTRFSRSNVRRYRTMSASDSADSGVILRSSDRIAPRSMRGSQLGSDHVSGSSGVSPVKTSGTPMCPGAPEDGASTAAQHRSSLVDEGEGDGDVDELSFKLYRPKELSRVETGASRESPLPPAVLTLRLPAKGIPGRVGTASGGSREQVAVGRYALLSHSSRLEEMRRLPPRTGGAGGELSCEATSNRGGMVPQDDMVRNSAADSFATDGTAGAFKGASQPQLMDSSMNSQLFLKSKKRGHGSHLTASVGAGVNRYESLCTPHASLHVSTETAAPTLLNCSGPHLLSSDQIFVATHARVHAPPRFKGQQPQQQEQQRQPLPHQRNGDVTGRPAGSADTAEIVATSSLSQSGGFALVRAPITGLRAKVLGNNAVEEEEAAEDPELRALQAEQLKNFYSKVLKHHRGDGTSAGGGEHAAAQTVTSPLVLAPAESAVGSTPTTLSTTAHGEQLTHDPALKSAWRRGSEDGDAAARKALKKKVKKVRFNMEGVEHRRGEPGATPLPHHGTPQPAGALKHRAMSPLILQDQQLVQESDVGASGVVAPEESFDHVNWQSPPPPTSLRLALRAGVEQPAQLSVASTTTSDVLVGSSDDAAGTREMRVMTPLRTPASPAPPHSAWREEVEGEREAVDAEEAEQPLATPLSPARVARPGLGIPSCPRLSVVNVSVPLPQPPQAPTPCSTSQSPSPTAAVAADPQKRRGASGSPRKTSGKKHRKAAVALVAGAGDPIVLAHSSASSWVPCARVSRSGSHASWVMSSTEVPTAGEEASEPVKGRKHTRQQVPNLQSLSSMLVEGQWPSPRGSAEGVGAPSHRVSVSHAAHQAVSPASLYCIPASLRSMQVVPNAPAPPVQTPLSPNSAPPVNCFASEAPSPRVTTERREQTGKRAKVRVLQPSPGVPPLPVKIDLPRLPRQPSVGLTGEEVEAPMASVHAKVRTPSTCLDEVPVVLPPFVQRPGGGQASASCTCVESPSLSGALAARDARLSSLSRSRTSLPQGETEAVGALLAMRSSTLMLPSLLERSPSRKP